MPGRLRIHPAAVATAGVVLGLGVGLAVTAQATTSSSTPSSPSASASSTPPRPPRGHEGPDGPGRHGKGGGGTLTAVSSSSITYAGPDGTARTAALNGSTTYAKDGTEAKQSDLAVGQHVRVRLVDPSATSPVAASVDIHSPHLGGTVASDNGGTIVVIDGEGFHRTIHTSGATTYTNSGQSATSSAVTTGQHLDAVGSIDQNGTDLDATRVNVGTRPRPTSPGSSAASSSTGSSSTTKAA
ncbi:MAG: hypothetical protein ACYDAD_14080 [Acidimicrobiales bacterium]